MRKYDIPLPRLLDGNGSTVRRIRPLNVSLDLTIVPLSYASMALPVGENLPARGYVELFSPLGSAGIYRVRSPQDAYGEDITTAELEHAIVEVGDYLVLAEYDEMMAASTAMQTIFSHYRGNKWQLGSVSAMGSTPIAVQADHVRVLEAMLALMDQCPECMLTFDFSTTPWTVSVAERGTVVSAEGRLSRNVNSARIIYDDTELCTRAYYEKATTEDADASDFPVFDVNQSYGAGTYLANQNKLYRLTADHAKGVTWENTQKELLDDAPASEWAYKDSGTANKYGLIERTVQTGSDYTPQEALVTVDRYLQKHKEPRVSVEISGEEFSSETGEQLDRFENGKLYRLALADYNVTVELNITRLSWQDVYGMPENVVVYLADEEDTAITFLHDMDSKGGSGGGGGGGRKQDELWKEYRTRFEQDDYHFLLAAERVNRAEQILQQAGLYINSNGVLTYAEDNEKNLAAKLKVQADKISLIVEDTEDGAKINPAAIVLAINDAISQITISADKIDINGIITQLATKELSAQGIRVGFANVGSLTASSLTIGNTSGSWKTATLNSYGLSASFSVEDTGGSTRTGRLVTSVTSNDIHYFGY